MKQMKTTSDTRLNSFCAFCGKSPNTRDHVPSKILLNKPFPENLPVVPACLECNHSFSLDEEYMACLLECTLCGTTEPKKLEKEKISKILRYKEALRNRLEQAKITTESETYFQVEESRIKNVVLKLAQGHLRYENSESQLEEPIFIGFNALSMMSEIERNNFLSSGETIKFLPEVGSRAFYNVLFEDEENPIENWVIVQENTYSYKISLSHDGLKVSILIWEYLACEVVW